MIKIDSLFKREINPYKDYLIELDNTIQTSKDNGDDSITIQVPDEAHLNAIKENKKYSNVEISEESNFIKIIF